ncbi:PREDICTED: beta carbonic anhydrase 1 isoform X3 [Vollenhovia emeryi]|uniref:beta carbonic anhydrase 1 isoform X3 n=1 Tax=Vollenhovia emeryi TaxID=411798 RepID=UPI0005F584AD|nr:PREDICTED: beta carbonic anhydrase 1 isoform X3 [Vollenhovia emeryi]
MDRILKGIMRYRKCHREGMVKQFQQVRDHPEPKAVFFTCMDSRMIPTRFTETNVGDMFVVRNPGNVVPHSQHFLDEFTMCESAALELGCVVNDIRHVIVCGHSDCKAMNLLYALRDEEFASQTNRRMSPLRAWLCAHASSSLTKFQHLEVAGFREPILFQAETPLRKFVAYIDPEDKFAIEDKLSQVSTRVKRRIAGGRLSRDTRRTCLADQHVAAAPEHRVVRIPEEAPGETRPAHPRAVVRHLHRRHLLL